MSVASLSMNRPDASAVTEGLNKALFATKTETAKAQTYHWNVTGLAFGPLHDLFQAIYEDHFAAEDDIAERLKALSQHVDGRLSSVLQQLSLIHI